MIPRYFLSPEAMDRLSADDTDVNEAEEQTGAMIALVPSDMDAAMLAVAGYEPADELHVTVEYLGEAANWTEDQQLLIAAAMSMAASALPPIPALLFATADFNPTSTKQCSCYLLNGEGLDDVDEAVDEILEQLGLDDDAPDQHEPWIPHICIGYGLDDDLLNYAGRTIMLDRLRVAFAGAYMDFPLTGPPDVDDTPDGGATD